MTEEVLGSLKGGFAAQERAQAEKDAREKRKGASYNSYEFLRLDAPEEGETYGESVILRLLTDEPDWETVKQHSFVPTKAAPKDLPEGRKWFPRFGAVCRYTIVPKMRGGKVVEESWFPDCYICDKVRVPSRKEGRPDEAPFAASRTWAWAVEREEVDVTQEMIDNGLDAEIGDTTYVDVMVDRTDSDGNTYQTPRYLVLNFGSKNFFDYFLGFARVYKGTVVDRDYKVTRQGKSTETDHSVVALDPVYEIIDGKRVKFDLRDERFADRYDPPVPLFDLIKEQVSDDHYNWFFNAEVETTWEGRFGKPTEKSEKSEKSNDSKPAEADKADDGDDEDRRARLAAMRAKMKPKANA